MSGRLSRRMRLGRRGAVDDQDVPVAGLGVGLDVAEGEDLVEAGDHRQLLGLDGVDAGPVEHLDQLRLDLAPGLLHPVLGVELLAREPLVADRRRRAAPSSTVEAVGQRVGRVGGHDEGAQPGVGAPQRGGGGDRSSCRRRPCR